MATKTIRTGNDIIIEVPEVRVYVADTLTKNDDDEYEFEEVSYLYVNTLRITAAPDIDVCSLAYEYGTMVRPMKDKRVYYSPLDLIGKYLKVEINPIRKDEEEPRREGDEPITWYGIVEYDSCKSDGGGQNGKLSSGRQAFVAFGLLRLLEKTYVDKSYVDDGDGGMIEINEALPFNFDPGGQFPATGNRSEEVCKNDPEDDEEVGCYVFSKYPRTTTKWTAKQAINYILKKFAPKDSDGEVPNEWILYGTQKEGLSLDWYEVSLNVELQTVKAVLDALIDRRRGLSYRCEFDEDSGQIRVRPFTFASEDVELSGSRKIYANGSLRNLDFESAFDITEAVVSDVATSRYHNVRAVGEWVTVTLTYPLYYAGDEQDLFDKDWTTEEESAFLLAAAEAEGYDDLDDDAKRRWNATARNSDKFKNVFSRFKIRHDFDGETQGWHDITPNYNLAPDYDPDDPTADIDPTTDGPKVTLALRLLNIMRHLPFRDRFDYSLRKIEFKTFKGAYTGEDQPGYLALMAYVRTEGDDDQVRDAEGELVEDPPRYDYVERLNYSAFDSVSGFPWACSVGVPSAIAGVEINAHPPQMIAREEWSAGEPSETHESQVPTLNQGLSWKNIFVTICIELPKRLQFVAEIEEPPEGVPVSEMVISVPRARLDYVLPYTTSRIENGIPIVNTTGGCIQDDRQRVYDIAKAAAQWYRNRKTLQLTYRQVRNLFSVGWLITKISPSYNTTDINTPITAIEYVFPDGQAAPYTRIETSFAELDFR